MKQASFQKRKKARRLVAVNQRGQIYLSQYHEKVPFIFTLEGKER
jgi:hypothetical protein